MKHPQKKTNTAEQKRRKAQQEHRRAKRETIWNSGVRWAGFLGWQLAAAIWFVLLLIVMFVRFWIGFIQGFRDEWRKLRNEYHERKVVSDKHKLTKEMTNRNVAFQGENIEAHPDDSIEMAQIDRDKHIVPLDNTFQTLKQRQRYGQGE